MRFLSLNRPPRNRLIYRKTEADEVEWRRQWRQIRKERPPADVHWSPRQFVTFVSVIVLLTVLLLIFSIK